MGRTSDQGRHGFDPYSPAGRMALTRRELLKRGGLAVAFVGSLPPLLAACGGADEEAAAPPPPAEPAAPPAPAAPRAPEASGTIDFLSWEGYDIPDAMAAWKEANDVDVKASYIATYDEIQAKLAAGAQGVDLITYNQAFQALYDELEIITSLDPDKVPNLRNLFPFFASDTGNFWVKPDGARFGVPWTWGSEGITYDSAAIPEPKSWYDLLEPEFKGKIGFVDSHQDNLFNAAHILGYDPARLTQDQLKEIADLLKQFVAQAKSISPSYGDMTTKLVSGEAVACFAGWAAMNSFAAAAGKTTVTTVLPKEGSISFCDAWAIPPTADNVDTVYAWMNETLEPTVHAAAAAFLVGGVTVADAVGQLDEATASLYPYDKLDELLERAPLYINPPTESDQYVTIDEWLDEWQSVKVGA